MRSEIFNRWEIKYIVPIKMMYQLTRAIESYVDADDNGDEGVYKIRSLYYDTREFKFYHEKIDGQTYRQKVRVRSYGAFADGDSVFFEIKQRHNSSVRKRRVKMNLPDAKMLIDGEDDIGEYIADDAKVIDEVKYLFSIHSLVPKLIVSYDRKAFMGKYEDDLRITFDTNLKCSRAKHMSDDKTNQKYFIHPGFAVLEIKANDKVPVWLISVIQRFNLETNRVSKYCLAVETLYDNY